ncbi:MAG: type II secretion system minor pseudopilin GspK [Bacillota bacterium]
MIRYGDQRIERGVALITALVFVFLAAMLAVKMQWQLTVDLSRTATLVQSDQAMEYALGAESWAEQILRRDYQQNPNATTLAQNWAQQLPPLPVQGGQIIGHIEDLQGRFNINNLAGGQNGASLQQFQRLLTALNLDPLLANAVSDWVNAGTTANPLGGAKDDTYTRLQPPYLTADAPMTSISELMLVNGVTPQVYAVLAPYVCALPVQTEPVSGSGGGAGTMIPVNINTASGPVLMSLDPHITADVASQIIGLRGDNGFGSPQQAQQALNGIALPATAGVNSGYFLLTVTVEIGTTRVTLYSLLYRSGGKVAAVRRTLGTL